MNSRIRKKQQKNLNTLEGNKKKTLKQKLSNINKKWTILVSVIIIMLGMIISLRMSYAYLYQTLRGQKSYSLKVKGFSLKLDDSSTLENIKIENSIPVSDEEGKNTNAYTFSIINEDTTDTGYVLYLDDVEIDNEINRMKDTVVKYQLIENGKETVGLVSDLGTSPFRILTNGVIGGNQTNNYSLRFWIKEDAEVSAGQVFNVKIRVIATSKEAIAEGKLVFGDTVVTSDSGVTSMTSDELQTYVDRALGNKIKTELDKQAQEYETKLSEQSTELQKKITIAKTQALNEAHPIGSIYISETNTNPSSLFGGTWTAYGQGRTLIGAGTGNDGTTSKSFAAGAIGGEYNHLLTVSEMPSHTHLQDAHNHIQSMWYGGYEAWEVQDSPDRIYVQNFNGGHILNKSMGSIHTNLINAYNGRTDSLKAINQNTGGSISHNNIQPYITVYMWKRTA